MYDPDGEFGIAILIAAAVIIIYDLMEPTSVAAPEDEEAAAEYEQNSEFNGLATFALEENPLYDAYAFIEDPGIWTGLAFAPLAGGVFKRFPQVRVLQTGGRNIASATASALN